MPQSDIAAHEERFTAYYQTFAARFPPDSEDAEHLHLKWEHSLRVAANAAAILAAPDLPPAFTPQLIHAAHLAALYHDVARFEQYVAFRTFRDAESANHGLWGAKILKVIPPFPAPNQGSGGERVRERGNSRGLTPWGSPLPAAFAPDDPKPSPDGPPQAALKPAPAFLAEESPRITALIRAAVAMHNRFAIPAAVPKDFRLVTQVVRDADKIDILRVIAAYAKPGGKRSQVVTWKLIDAPDAWTPSLYNAVINGRLGISSQMRYINDFLLLLCSWVYDLNFPTSRTLMRKQGHIHEILAGLPNHPAMHKVRAVVEKTLQG